MKKRTLARLAISGTILLGTAMLASPFAMAQTADYNNTYGISHITRYDMSKIPGQQSSPQFEVPNFDASTLKNLHVQGPDANGNLVDLDVWDSWPLQNADGTVATYNGYHLVFALAGDPSRSWDTHIYLFYQKADETSIDSWKSAGRVFKDSDKCTGDPILAQQTEEWSGSATLTADNKVRLFYTDRGAYDPANALYGKQTLTTAQVNLSQPDASTVQINGVQDLKSVFDGGDGTVYQNVNQGQVTPGDNHTLRDPHYVEDNGHKYLVFEANTGTTDGYQGDDSLFNQAYYGGSFRFFQTEKDKLLSSPLKDAAAVANGALGIIELNNDYSLKEVLPPLITSNTVTDEIERANVFKMNGRWYLFTDSRGSKMTIDGIAAKDIYMLGYSSNSLTGSYKPLNNGSGLVLHMDKDYYDPTFTYSHFAVPQAQGNNVVITSYITNRSISTEHHSSFAPSFLLNIFGNNTKVVPGSILAQGQLTVDNSPSQH